MANAGEGFWVRIRAVEGLQEPVFQLLRGRGWDLPPVMLGPLGSELLNQIEPQAGTG